MSLYTLQPEHCKLSRRITINLNQKLINVRPIIQHGLEEASFTLAESYPAIPLRQFQKHLRTGLKQQRTLQADGCKGVIHYSLIRGFRRLTQPRPIRSYTESIMIRYLAVLPYERRKGYGAALVEQVVKRAGSRQVFLEATVEVVPFFERLGFEVVRVMGESVWMVRWSNQK